MEKEKHITKKEKTFFKNAKDLVTKLTKYEERRPPPNIILSQKLNGVLPLLNQTVIYLYMIHRTNPEN
jgi:hypothetical protein